MRRFATGLLMVMAMTVLTSCFIEGPVPYTYSPVYCSGCWYGMWEGREGWHYGGERPWEREHHEGDHRGEGHRGEGERHAGHRSNPHGKQRAGSAGRWRTSSRITSR